MKSDKCRLGQRARATDPTNPAYFGNVGLRYANPTYDRKVSGTAVPHTAKPDLNRGGIATPFFCRRVYEAAEKLVFSKVLGRRSARQHILQAQARLAQRLFRCPPVHAGVGHGDPEFELRQILGNGLVAGVQIALQHHTDD